MAKMERKTQGEKGPQSRNWWELVLSDFQFFGDSGLDQKDDMENFLKTFLIQQNNKMRGNNREKQK